MDFVALIVGICIGAIVGFAIAWMWATSAEKAKKSASHSSETELKALLSQQAKSFLESSRDSIQSVEQELSNLRNSVAEFENTLDVQNEDTSKSSYFGEHAGMFLRNSDSKQHRTLIAESSDNQPRDFANNGSGLFVGSPANETQKKKEKHSN